MIIGYIAGDLSGLVHTAANQPITIRDGDIPFPTSVRVYENTDMDLPAGTHIV